MVQKENLKEKEQKLIFKTREAMPTNLDTKVQLLVFMTYLVKH